MYSGKPAASIVVNELIAECGLGKPEGRRRLNEAGRRAVDVTAERLALLVDDVLGKKGRPGVAAGDGSPKRKEGQATCACGSGIPVTRLVIDGKAVEIVALPLIFQNFHDAGRLPDEALACELLETVKVYNAVPAGAEGLYREAILGEYAMFCRQEKAR